MQTPYVEKIPIPFVENELQIELHVKEILKTHKALFEIKIDFTDYCTHALKIKKLTQKLQSPETLTLEELLTELQKQKVDIKDFSVLKSFKSLHVTMCELKTKIAQIDQTIDTLVYGLYGLSKEDIEILEKIK